MNYEFVNPGPISADIKTGSGAVIVTAGAHSGIAVQVEPMDSSSASREAAEQTRVSLDGKHLVVHTPQHRGWSTFKGPKLKIVAHIPQDSVVTVKAASADITCDGVYAELMAHTASGDLRIDRVAKNASINSASGDVRIGWVGGSLHANSASGDITAQHVGADLDAHAASGDITLGRVDGDIRAKTASGDIKIGVARQGEIRARSASGDVVVGVAAGTSVWLDLQTVSGKTRSDLAMVDSAPPTGTNLQLKLRTVSGDITLNRVAAVTEAPAEVAS